MYEVLHVRDYVRLVPMKNTVKCRVSARAARAHSTVQPRAWGSGECARLCFHSSSTVEHTGILVGGVLRPGCGVRRRGVPLPLILPAPCVH